MGVPATKCFFVCNSPLIFLYLCTWIFFYYIKHNLCTLKIVCMAAYIILGIFRIIWQVQLFTKLKQFRFNDFISRTAADNDIPVCHSSRWEFIQMQNSANHLNTVVQNRSSFSYSWKHSSLFNPILKVWTIIA